MSRLVLSGLLMALAGAVAHAADVASAEANLRRIEVLVQEGAAPRAALETARRQLQNARNEQVLKDTLYSGNVLPDQVPAMLRAASELRDQAAEALTAQEKLVAEGVVPPSGLERWREDLGHAERQWALAQSRAKLVEELAEMARREAELAEAHQDLLERFAGKDTLSDRDFLYIETAYYEEFSKPLPVSARGATVVHRSLGFDHRDRFDVALNPDQQEGRWLIRLLERLGVPYIPYRRAVAGKSTGAHIHVGLPSPRVPFENNP
jgi:hypothetical protein